MSILQKESAPGYKSEFTGQEIDELLRRLARSYEPAYVEIPSTEAVPINIDKLVVLGRYSIEYITKSVLPTKLKEHPIRPYEVVNTMVDGRLQQVIASALDLWVRYYDPDQLMPGEVADPESCACGCSPKQPQKWGTWSLWEYHRLTTSGDCVISVDGPDLSDEFDDPSTFLSASSVMISKTDGSKVSLQNYYEQGLLPEGNPDKPSNPNDNANVVQSTPIQWRSDQVTILHDGQTYSLADIMTKIINL